MRGVRAWAVAVALIGVTASPALAGMAAIETAAPLADQSDDSVRAAVSQAVEQAVQGAKAMGLPLVELRGARVLEGAVTVLVIASDGVAGPLENTLGTQYDGDEDDDASRRRRRSGRLAGSPRSDCADAGRAFGLGRAGAAVVRAAIVGTAVLGLWPLIAIVSRRVSAASRG
jgi:hypothetical protein